MWPRLARYRVPLGFLSAAVAFGLARPTSSSWWVGAIIASMGEVIRVWAAGHLEKGREITRSGPYRFVRHPLYLGSAVLGAGLVVAAQSLVVLVLTAVYLAVMLTAAIRTEESTLDERFAGAYSGYRAGTIAPMVRAFSWERVRRNREPRAILGLVAAFALLWFQIRP